MADILIVLALLAVLIVPTFYGLWRAALNGEWGWFAGIGIGWLLGIGWLVDLIFLLGPDRKARRCGMISPMADSAQDESVDRISRFEPWGYWAPQTGLRPFEHDEDRP